MSKIEEIKQHAIRLMAGKGYEAMSLRQLAAAVGVRSGSVYSHYQSKSQLLQDVCCDFHDELMACWLMHREQGAPAPHDMLLRFAAVYLGFCHARIAETRIISLDYRSLDEPGRSQVAELRQELEAELERILRQGIQIDAFPAADLRLTLPGILALLKGFSTMAGEMGVSEKLDPFEACAAVLLRMVGVRSSALTTARAARLYAELRGGDVSFGMVPPLSSVG